VGGATDMSAYHIVPGTADWGVHGLNYRCFTQSGKKDLLLPTRFFAVDAVYGVERAQSTVGVRALNL
jgi:hypothetical protein